MLDIQFDIISREIVMVNNDFATTSNPSVQNGGIIQFSRCAFINNPMLGIGMEEVINSNSSKTAFEMNRWQQQCKQDGATIAKWSPNTVTNNTIQVNTQISYL